MESQKIANRLVQDHVVYALAAGAIPVPLADVAAITAVQVDLIRALARVYGVTFDPATGKALVVALAGASAVRIGASALKAVPGLGLVPGVIAQAGLAGASTYAIGQLFSAHFAQQGNLSDLDPESVRPHYQALLEKGKAFVQGLLKRGRSIEEITELLERLTQLRTQSTISEAELERLKSEILGA